MLISSTGLAEDGVPFPGKTISLTVVRELTTGNNTLTVIFERAGKSLRLASIQSPLNGLDLAWNDPNLFTIHLSGNAQPLASSAMKMAVTGPLAATFTDDATGLRAHWTAAIKDGANYLTQSIRLEATRGAVTVDRIEMIRASVQGAKVTGYTDGSPITNDKLFLGIEHPMAQNTVTGTEVAASSTVVCSLPRQCTLEPGTTWTVTSGIGVYPVGQLRRAFLYYLERERAHPYRQYWHYNSWYDLNIGVNDNPDPLKRMNEQQCLDVIRAFGTELHGKRGVGLDGFVWDDGWDDWNSLWGFHEGFPNGFAKLKEEAAQQGAGMGAWLSPWGGYGGSQAKRVAFGKSKGYETNPGGFSLGGPKYYAAYRDTCVRFIRDYNMNYFKFDGIGGGMYATGAPASIAPDLDNLVRLLRELRQANPDVFINCTVGTWASPYWTWFADSVWRQGEDCAYTGEGNARERWITYRDERIYTRFANPSPLYPLNSMMYHGLLVGSRHAPAAMPNPAQNIESYRHELLMSVGCGSGLGELYVTPSLMTAEAWDILAEGLKWSRAHSDILCDTHWVGGHPVKEVYGYASWHPAKGGTVVLRNPTSKEQMFVLNPQQIFELPVGAPPHYKFTPELNSQIEPLSASADKPAMLTLQPFQVVLMEATPAAMPIPEGGQVFNATTPVNDLKGSLEAQVLFAQSQVIPARPREGDRQPRLVSLRPALVMVRPLRADAAPIALTAVDGAGQPLGTLTLNPPKSLPVTAYFVFGAPADGVDFAQPDGAVGVVNDPSAIALLAEPHGTSLRELLSRHAVVRVETADGRWTRDIHLPPGKGLDGKMVRVDAGASYASTIHYGARSVSAGRGQSLAFKCANGQWFREGELDNNRLRYAADAWSAVLPAEWLRPGLRLRFRQGSVEGELASVSVGAPTQLLLHTIDLGFLTPPRAAFAFAKDAEAHREYFQTLPASRLIVSQYAPLHLTEVMLPTGVLLKDADPGNGGWHEGTMRQHIGKELISHGIDNANYGLHSSAGRGEKSHPYVVAQLTVHNSRGQYANGVQVHGGSGGNGIVTLDDSLGNEFSHEVGHNFGLGHYVDGFRGSVHRSADQINSTWGWDADKGRFLPNFSPVRTGKDTTLEERSQSPFDGRAFGYDAMAGGAPFSSFNRFTLYTPNTAAIIQQFLEGKAVFDPLSPTGFSKWDEAAGRMLPYAHRLEGAAAVPAPINGLSEASLGTEGAETRKPQQFGVPVVTLVGYYDPSRQLKSYVYPALHGALGFCYADDADRLRPADCQLVVETKTGLLRFKLEGRRLDNTCMNKFHINVPAASEPRNVAIVCGGKELDKRAITAVAGKLAVTVNGYVPPAPDK